MKTIEEKAQAYTDSTETRVFGCEETLDATELIQKGFIAGAKSALSMSGNVNLLNMATVFMQGMLSNPNICNLQNMNAEAVVVLARNAMICAKALKMVFEKESND